MTFPAGTFFNSIFASGKSCDVNFVSVRAPPSTKPTDSFVIQTFRSGYNVDSISTGVVYVASPGQMQAVSIRFLKKMGILIFFPVNYRQRTDYYYFQDVDLSDQNLTSELVEANRRIRGYFSKQDSPNS